MLHSPKGQLPLLDVGDSLLTEVSWNPSKVWPESGTRMQGRTLLTSIVHQKGPWKNRHMLLTGFREVP